LTETKQTKNKHGETFPANQWQK